MQQIKFNITLSVIGKLKPGVELDLYNHYRKRLIWDVSVKEFEIKKPLTIEQKKLQESELLLSACQKTDYIIGLDENGIQLSSTQFASTLERITRDNGNNVSFIIGGADGLHQKIREKADMMLSFGKMTFPHLLVRCLLMEQLYRSYTIITKHPYHRE